MLACESVAWPFKAKKEKKERERERDLEKAPTASHLQICLSDYYCELLLFDG